MGGNLPERRGAILSDAVDRKGRLDLLAADGLGSIVDRIGAQFGIPLRKHVQPVIDRFVRENISGKPVTPESIAEDMGLLKRQRRIGGKR